MTLVWKLGDIEVLENKKLLSITPNDLLLSYQGGLGAVGAQQAWVYNTGSKDVVVAVIDSGIDLNHNDLKDNIWRNIHEIPNDDIDNENNGYIDDIYGWNFANNTNDVQDIYGHGTHVSGIIGAKGNNLEGVSGTNWDVKIMPLKFMDNSGAGNTGGIIQAMDYILKMKRDFGVNVVVVNNSWGGGVGFSNMLYEKMRQLKDNNIVCVTAAGNSGIDSDLSPRYPGSFDLDNIINVAASNSSRYELATYSNYGVKNVDIVAPGTSIYSTTKNNNYGYKSGTSMAAPFVTGAVALLNSVKPNIGISEVRNLIFGSVDKVYSLFDKVGSGGRLNMGSLVHKALNIPYSTNVLPDGAVMSMNLREISGWAIDPDSSICMVQLVVDNIQKSVVFVDDNGKFNFSLDNLRIGNNQINILVKDEYSGQWRSIYQTIVTIPTPIVKVTQVKISRISGWAYSSREPNVSLEIRLIINGQTVATQIASKYQPDSIIESIYHGFKIKLKKGWLRKGSNTVSIEVAEPVSKQLVVGWAGVIKK